jgi:hypothetical protein
MEAHLVNTFDFVEIGNRTSKTLSVTYDGKQWVLPPFPATVKVPRIVADVACRQHPRMGTEDPYNPHKFELLVYVKEWKQPDTAIEQTDKLERINRDLLPPDRRKTQLREMQYRPTRAMDVGEGGGADALFDGRGANG